MKVQPCAIMNNNAKAYSLTFKGEKNRSIKSKTADYFAHMADHSNQDTGLSVFTGATIGAISSRKNFKKEFPAKALKNVGGLMVFMYALRSLQFLIFKNKKENKM